ncbi:serpin B4-like [Pollicipes pollicipes]|uniref:serpin B4-like n=1 Tax=Pollicipes pollicipes TaxID=41117 RepID=UPI001884BC9D|nr:serpin B4-like [Pollicipes pollicipes]
MQLLVGAAVLLAVVTGSLGQCLTSNDTAINATNAANIYISGSHNFSIRLFQKLYSGDATKERNLFYSPHSLWCALSLAYFGAEGDTQTQMEEVMGLTQLTKVDVLRAFRFIHFWEDVRKMDDTVGKNTLRVANRLYFDKNEDVKECMKELFHNELEMLDFIGASEESRQTINSWVETQTADRIKDLIPPGAVDATTRMVLANAAYFKGTWDSQFKPDRTKPELFYSSKEEVTFVNMMKQKGQFNFGVSEELQAHILELPYQGDEISMFILLPPFMEGALDTTVSRLTPELLRQTIEFMWRVDIHVQLPKFRIEESYQMSEDLIDLGFENLFNASAANLNGFSHSGNLVLTRALHKSFLEINEEGAEAAAATALITMRTSRPSQPERFICNHPFMYVIYDKMMHTMLFMGTFEHPKAAALSLDKNV